MNLLIHPLDVTIIIAYLIGTVILGIWLGRGDSSTRGYFLGGKQLPWWALLLSIVASETSTVTFLSIPGLIFKDGGNFGFLQLAIGFMLGRVAVAWLILPHYFRGDLLTSYELLDARLGNGTRRLTSGLFLVTRTIGDALRLFLTALVLYKVINLNLPVCVVVVGVVTIVYTFAGGLKSVVWNDCIQFAVYIFGAAWALFFIVNAVGWNAIWEFGFDTGRIQVVDTSFNLGKLNIWVGLIGGGFLSFATHGTDHLVVQRLLGAKSEVDARKALILSGVVVFFQFAFFLLIGLALACFYNENPPAQSFTDRYDEVFVSFIVGHLQTGVVGLILAAVFAAALSTQSSSLNSLAGAFVNDFYKSRGNENNDKKLLRAGRLATVVFGVLQMGVAIFAYFFLMENRSTVDFVFQIAAFAYGPVLGLFLLSLTQMQQNSRTALGAFAMGLILVVNLKIMSLESVGMLELNGLWFTVIGSIATFVAGVILSKFDKR